MFKNSIRIALLPLFLLMIGFCQMASATTFKICLNSLPVPMPTQANPGATFDYLENVAITANVTVSFKNSSGAQPSDAPPKTWTVTWLGTESHNTCKAATGVVPQNAYIATWSGLVAPALPARAIANVTTACPLISASQGVSPTSNFGQQPDAGYYINFYAALVPPRSGPLLLYPVANMCRLSNSVLSYSNLPQ